MKAADNPATRVRRLVTVTFPVEMEPEESEEVRAKREKFQECSATQGYRQRPRGKSTESVTSPFGAGATIASAEEAGTDSTETYSMPRTVEPRRVYRGL